MLDLTSLPKDLSNEDIKILEEELRILYMKRVMDFQLEQSRLNSLTYNRATRRKLKKLNK